MAARQSPRSKTPVKLISATRLLSFPRIRQLQAEFPAYYVKETLKAVLREVRLEILDAGPEHPEPIDVSPETIEARIDERIRQNFRPGVRPAINASGIILHTGLGRAPFAEPAREALAAAVRGYCTLEVEEATGRRGSRHRHVEHLLTFLTGAEAACVVNNNAAAVLLVLNSLADGREVIISRGQLVEIGGAFRMPDVMAGSGAAMVEVGTTNRTHFRDYESAVSGRTAMIQVVHPSNYRISGFTSDVPLARLRQLCDRHGLALVHDIGSGCLLDLSRYGLSAEPLVQDSVAAGADVVTFSGDKLLGGPQCGIIVGKKELLDGIIQNPLCRVLRCDKIIYSVLEATLKLFLDRDTLARRLPVLSMATEPLEAVRRRAESLIELVRPQVDESCRLELVDGESQMGSGSMPARAIPTGLVALECTGLPTEELGRRLRTGDPPVFARIADGRLMLDLRTVSERECRLLAASVIRALRQE